MSSSQLVDYREGRALVPDGRKLRVTIESFEELEIVELLIYGVRINDIKWEKFNFNLT